MDYRADANLSKGYPKGVEAMKYLCALVCALLFGVGCASDGDRAKWDDAMRDLRGDNMQMHNSFSGMTGMGDHP
jgi:hypothetical protein